MSRPPLPIAELSAAFRLRAGDVGRFAPGAAEAFTFCAEWLDASLEAHLDTLLTVAAAAAESGWSYEGLRRQLIGRPSLNAGDGGAPLIRRRDLALIGAPRGSRGPYGPRKSKDSGRGPVAEQRESTAAEDRRCTSGEAPRPPAGRLVEARNEEPASGHEPATPDETAERGLVGSESEAVVDVGVEAPAITPDDDEPSGEHRPRSPGKRTRCRSPKDRFGELLALAARS